MAIQSNGKCRRTLKKIYEWIEKMFPYFKYAKPGKCLQKICVQNFDFSKKIRFLSTILILIETSFLLITFDIDRKFNFCLKKNESGN